MADSKEDVASKGLARLGEGPISSFEEDTDAAEKVNLLYEPEIQRLLAAHPWRWARKKYTLEIDGAETPLNEWTYAYLLPDLGTERVGPPLQFFNSTAVHAPVIFNFEISGRWVYTNETTIIAECIERKTETLWPPYFEALAIEAIATILALPVTENQSKDDAHRRIAFGSPSEQGKGGLFKAAMEADNQGSPTPSLLDDDDPITAARFGGSF